MNEDVKQLFLINTEKILIWHCVKYLFKYVILELDFYS